MTQTITYTLLDPAGNKTILAETPVPAEAQPFVAKKLMEAEPSSEQVGFVSLADRPQLRMAGGEFCGNAALSAAALYFSRKEQSEGTVNLQVSGAMNEIPVFISCVGENKWNGTLTMPVPLSVKDVCYPNDCCFPTVFFPGIAHVLIQGSMKTSQAEKLAVQFCGFLDVPALGLMFLDLENNTLDPLVYVRKADTLFWESSCASGTTAVGAYLFDKLQEPLEISLKQPGGALKVTVDNSTGIHLNGDVSLIRTASLDVSF